MLFSPLETSQVYFFPRIQIEEDKLGRLHTNYSHIYIFASFCIFVLARESMPVQAFGSTLNTRLGLEALNYACFLQVARFGVLKSPKNA